MIGGRDESMSDNELIGNLITVHKLWFVLSGNHRPVQRHQDYPGIKMVNGVSRSLAALAVTLGKFLRRVSRTPTLPVWQLRIATVVTTPVLADQPF